MSLPYEPPVSVWGVVRKALKSDQEKMFMREILGETLVDQTVELHAEVDNLLEIWREFRAETTTILTTPSPSKSTSSSTSSRRQALPEPPEVRFRLKKEIQFYVEALQSKAEKEGRQLEQVLRSFNNDVLQYALETKTTKRPSTGKSQRDGRETPLVDRQGDHRPGSQSETLRGSVEGLKTLSVASSPRSSNLSSAAASTTASVKLTEDSAYGEILDKIREELKAEVKTLYDDIEFLQRCLEGESDFRCDSSVGFNSEPSLSDLKEERTKLERHLLADGAAGDAFGGGGGGSGGGRVMAWEKTPVKATGIQEPNLRPIGGALPSFASSSSSSSSSSYISTSSTTSKTFVKQPPLPPTPSSTTSTNSRRRLIKEQQSSSSGQSSFSSPSSSSSTNRSSAPLRAIHSMKSSQTQDSASSNSSSTPLAAALDSLAPAVFNNLHHHPHHRQSGPRYDFDGVVDQDDDDREASVTRHPPLGPAARQPFGSTERLRIRSPSPRSADNAVEEGNDSTASDSTKISRPFEASSSSKVFAESASSSSHKPSSSSSLANADKSNNKNNNDSNNNKDELSTKIPSGGVRKKTPTSLSTATTSSSSPSSSSSSSSSFSSSSTAPSRSKVVTLSAVQRPLKSIASSSTASYHASVERSGGRGGAGSGGGAPAAASGVEARKGRGSDAASPDSSSLDALLAPTPPPTPPNRNAMTSAHAARFRRMVINCREDE